MPVPESIGDLLRQEIAVTGSNSFQLAKALKLNQPSLWRFINDRVDPKLATAEQLLRHFGYVVVREDHAKANGLAYIRPAADPPTKRKDQRERNAAARAKAAKGAKVPKASPAKRPAPKRSGVARPTGKHPARHTRRV